MTNENSASALKSIGESSKSYYDKGSMELAVTTPVMSQRLETRRNMTTGHSTTRHSNADDAAERLLIVLVGLPARGKSFIARKLWNYLVWRSNQCRIFNVGKYRRQLATTDSEEPNVQKADFFDDNNKTAAKLRQEAARLALKATLEWLNESSIENNNGDDDDNESGDKQIPLSYSARRVYHRVAIFDATNSSRARREWILQECAKSDKETGRTTGVLFLESICDDRELLEENFQVKISSSPDFDHMTKEEALEDLRARIATYESRYETIDIVDPTHPISFIKIFNLSSRLMVNHIYGRLAKVVLPAIMAWNTGSRPIYLCRAGETKAMEEYVKQSSNNNGLSSPFMKVKRKRSDPLGGRGYQFRDALGDFIEQEGLQFMKTNHPSVHTGTSIAGLYEESSKGQNEADASTDGNTVEHTPAKLPFPCLVMSSTMPRAVETATWEKHPFPIKDVTNLNPLDMGDFSGMDLASIQEEDSEWYEQLKKDPFHTRFPGGESYGDLIDRLYSVIVDMEQQLGLAVAVGHLSVLQVLISYFRTSPILECMDIEVPMNTVFKFVPLRGGGWLESKHVLLKDHKADNNTNNDDSPAVWDGSSHSDARADKDVPIWGDRYSCLPIL